MNAVYSLEMISVRAAGVNTYFRDPGMISSEKRRSVRKSVWLDGWRREGKNEDSADIVMVVVSRADGFGSTAALL